MAARLQVPGNSPDPAAVLASAREILAGRDILSIATLSPELGPHANQAFFAVDADLTLWFVSERTTRHSRNISADPRTAASVFLDPPVYGEGLRGVQLRGPAREAGPEERPAALAVLRDRFPAFAEAPHVREGFLAGELPATFYRIDVAELTVLDEPRFGRRVYVPATVLRP
ncbi:pyridoxamine 5'-phosphate oxidase family protein [Actinoplanes sp. NPDC051494]|uniref:pyridoxamine 5'-phosphate oxidase family protein n=1 Tax=Actinoplanes sp. NPDC051494 TaxID=3363907 RepID=UPI0037B9A7D7